MLRVTDAPGYCTALPWGASTEEGGDRNAQQRHWRTRSIFPSLSPRIFLHLAVYSGTVAISTEKYTEGLHPERPARGAVLYTGQFRSCIEHKGPPSTKNMHTKDGHDSRGRNYKAETQLPTFAWASLPI